MFGVSRVRWLLFGLFSSSVLSLMISILSFGLSCYLFYEDFNRGAIGPSQNSTLIVPQIEVPGLSILFATNCIMIFASAVAIYGSVYKLRGAILSYLAVGYVSCSLQIVVASFVASALAEEDDVNEEFHLAFNLVIFSSVSMYLLLLVASIVFMVDPYGKTFFEADLAWLGPGAVTRFMFGLLGTLIFQSAAIFSLTLVFYIYAIYGYTDTLPLTRVPSASWGTLGLCISNGLVFLQSVGCGCFGTRRHLFWPLVLFLGFCSVFLAFSYIASFVLLWEVGIARNELAEIQYPIAKLGAMTTMGAFSLIITSFEISVIFFLSVVVYTDSASVYQADYL